MEYPFLFLFALGDNNMPSKPFTLYCLISKGCNDSLWKALYDFTPRAGSYFFSVFLDILWTRSVPMMKLSQHTQTGIWWKDGFSLCWVRWSCLIALPIEARTAFRRSHFFVRDLAAMASWRARCVAVDFLETRAFGQRALGWGAFVQCEGWDLVSDCWWIHCWRSESLQMKSTSEPLCRTETGSFATGLLFCIVWRILDCSRITIYIVKWEIESTRY